MAISHIYREALSEADPQAIREIISMFKAIIGKAIESESPDIEVAIAAEETVSVGGLEGIASDLTGIGEAAFEMVGEFLFLAVAVRGTYKLYQVLEEYKNRLRNHHECLKKEHLASLSKLEEELDNKHAKLINYLDDARLSANQVTGRPRESGVDGAIKRYLETQQLAQARIGFRNQQKIHKYSSTKLLPPQTD